VDKYRVPYLYFNLTKIFGLLLYGSAIPYCRHFTIDMLVETLYRFTKYLSFSAYRIVSKNNYCTVRADYPYIPLLSQVSTLEQEVESLRTVLEMRTTELHESRLSRVKVRAKESPVCPRDEDNRAPLVTSQ
jgi:hypothetical protein